MLVRREHSRKPEEAYEMIELMTQSFAVARSFVIP
jgi:N6-adenosine-specific RNA methylase IME4